MDRKRALLLAVFCVSTLVSGCATTSCDPCARRGLFARLRDRLRGNNQACCQPVCDPCCTPCCDPCMGSTVGFGPVGMGSGGFCGCEDSFFGSGFVEGPALGHPGSIPPSGSPGNCCGQMASNGTQLHPVPIAPGRIAPQPSPPNGGQATPQPYRPQ